MTAAEFKQGYCERSEITAFYFDKVFVVLPCDCGEAGCHGWQAAFRPDKDRRDEDRARESLKEGRLEESEGSG